jgi:hypothetical protein
MHEMTMAAIITPPPSASSDTSGEVDPTGSTVLTWNHKNFYSISIIFYTVSHRLIHKQTISSESTKINYNPHIKSLDKSQLIREVSKHDCSDHVCIFNQERYVLTLCLPTNALFIELNC